MLVEQKRSIADAAGTLRPASFCLIFIQYFSCVDESLRSRLTLREEGQVAGLESPNALGARSGLSGGQPNVDH